jgi:hypothetical protein
MTVAAELGLKSEKQSETSLSLHHKNKLFHYGLENQNAENL